MPKDTSSTPGDSRRPKRITKLKEVLPVEFYQRLKAERKAGRSHVLTTEELCELVDRVITERVLRGRCPADEPLDPAETFLPPDPVPVIPDEVDDPVVLDTWDSPAGPASPDTPDGTRHGGERP